MTFTNEYLPLIIVEGGCYHSEYGFYPDELIEAWLWLINNDCVPDDYWHSNIAEGLIKRKVIIPSRNPFSKNKWKANKKLIIERFRINEQI